jgi:hypothetical protein
MNLWEFLLVSHCRHTFNIQNEGHRSPKRGFFVARPLNASVYVVVDYGFPVPAVS